MASNLQSQGQVGEGTDESGLVTLAPKTRLEPAGEVLLAHRRFGDEIRWCDELESTLRRARLSFFRAHSGREVVRRVERGGLAAAVLVGDEREIDGLSILRIVRSIDAALPCWLVMRRMSRHTLQTAFSLRVSSVIHYASGADDLSVALRGILADGSQRSR